MEGTPDSGSNCAGNVMLSYIWVANSDQNTISKIATSTMIEEGRYRTRATPGRPSRTSVNLGGDVAVANRDGGVTKVIANPEHCDEMTNGVPGLQTSGGPNDILPWGEDDCVVWHTPIPHTANRPVVQDQPRRRDLRGLRRARGGLHLLGHDRQRAQPRRRYPRGLARSKFDSGR